ncbi:MAG: serine protease [Pirellulaceae bacterium]|jgi:serine protease Do|nr:serine protease [Pirellulaceae bacterium]
MKRQRLKGWLAIVACFSFDVCAIAQSNSSDQIPEVIAATQQKMVKVFGATAGKVDGFGSGVLISDDGLIVTAQGIYLDGSHVRVLLADGSEHLATILKRDRTLQLALLRIDQPTPDFFDLSKPIEFARGDWILAISNAFKVADHDEPLSVTMGTVSLTTTIDARLNARDVAYQGELVLIDAITSNPGAAGGAVVNLKGELIGTIGKIINSSETNTRLNYAVPTKLLAKFVAEDVTAASQATDLTMTREPVDLGIKLLALGGRRNPAYIDRVISDGPAAKAGLQPDDLIISIAGEKVGSLIDYDAAVEKLFPDEEIVVMIKRGSQVLQIPLTPARKQ